ncbi:MAG: hypothetical protein CMH81_04240 [Nitrospiraceae bacterium]|nr:hypothetical protein [Nitrospiraceae bacterium]|tara:strand:- start:2004 stop:2444 length:441 start_codon:yes stop_codon:yes gene_type:complete
MWSFGKTSEVEELENAELLTFVGRGAELSGDIKVEGSARVDGMIEGSVHVKGTLIVGKHAVIKGDVTTKALLSSGNIRGDVIALERVKLLSPCVLTGSVQTPLLSVEEGVLISGTCDMVSPSSDCEDRPIEELLQQHEDYPVAASR